MQTKKYERILSSRQWVINNYVDNSQNITIDTQYIVYTFKADGELEKEYDNGYIVTANWELTEDNNYLRIGNNFFRIQSISRKLLSLRYGDIDIFFVSL
jgi:hypothetical protein